MRDTDSKKPAEPARRRRALVAAGAVALLLTFGAAAFVWDEARKEVVFLCGNFAPGTTERSVIRQLDTASFLRRERLVETESTTLVVDSAWNLGRYRCVIEFDEDAVVMRAGVE